MVATEVRRYLTLLEEKIRHQGFQQLEVEQALGWRRCHLSDLFTEAKKLRLDDVLLILGVIGVEPGEFFAELYAKR